MNVHKVFTIITNLFGLNFYEQYVSLSLVFFIHLIINIYQVVNIYYAFITDNPKNKPIFFVINSIQLIIPLAIKNYVMWKAVILRNFDLKFDLKTRKIYENFTIKKNQETFIKYLVACILLLLLKLALFGSVISIIYNMANFIPNMLNASNDFLFVYQTLSLKDHVKSVVENYEKRCIKEEVLNIIELRRQITLRHSKSLAYQTSLNFILIILSLFWIFLRIVFSLFKSYAGKLRRKLLKSGITLWNVFRLRDLPLFHSTVLLSLVGFHGLQKLGYWGKL